MIERIATCRCGQLRLVCKGEPVRVSVCHCLECQKRSGSAFAYQARWPDDCVSITGETRAWPKASDSGAIATFNFCPTCGATLFYTTESMPGLTAIAVGAFQDPEFPAPEYSVYEGRKHRWLRVEGDGIAHYD